MNKFCGIVNERKLVELGKQGEVDDIYMSLHANVCIFISFRN